MKTDTKSPTPNFKNLVRGRECRGISKELEDIPATGPWFTIVAVVLFHKELTGAWQRSVIACLFVRIVRDPMVPTV
jgi:hypothetical protein